MKWSKIIKQSETKGGKKMLDKIKTLMGLTELDALCREFIDNKEILKHAEDRDKKLRTKIIKILDENEKQETHYFKLTLKKYFAPQFKTSLFKEQHQELYNIYSTQEIRTRLDVKEK